MQNCEPPTERVLVPIRDLESLRQKGTKRNSAENIGQSEGPTGTGKTQRTGWNYSRSSCGHPSRFVGRPRHDGVGVLFVWPSGAGGRPWIAEPARNREGDPPGRGYPPVGTILTRRIYGCTRPRRGRSGHSKYSLVESKSAMSRSSKLIALAYLLGSTSPLSTFLCHRPPL